MRDTGYRISFAELASSVRDTRFKMLVVLFLLWIGGGLPLLAQQQPDKKKVIIEETDYIRSMVYNGRTINRLIGNVKLVHNGAVMTCDSAYQFSSSEFEAYSRVVVVKDGTTMYGDILNYDGTVNLAQVRGKVVRLVDKTTTLRTQYLDYDTKESIGYFYNGGTITDKDSQIESAEGYYYSKKKLFEFADSVELRNDTYEIRCESGSYNTNTDVAVFTGHTNIWHKDGFLACDSGWDDKGRDYFHFSKNAYLQSQEQEVWADTIFYDRLQAKGDLYGHIQLHDTVQAMIAFGDEGHFFEDPKEAVLTKQPSVAYYSVEDNQPDTLFLRADTLHFVTEPNPLVQDSGFEIQDSGFEIQDSTDSTAAALPDSVALLSPDSVALAPVDSTVVVDAPLDSAVLRSSFLVPHSVDSLAPHSADSVALAPTDSTVVAAAPPDSVIQKVFAFYNARVYRQDIQAACDSFAYSSLDSLGRMFGRPVMWNEGQQITAEEIHFLTDRKNIIRADFLKSAFIITHEQDTFYNQVKGRDIIAHFRNNDVYLLDVLGGAQTVYYLQEDSLVANGNLAESASMQIDVKERKIQRIKYHSNPVIDTYPLEQLPADKSRLKGYEWRDAERPKSRWEICKERPHASRRREVSQIPKPTFPITERINSIK